MRRIQQLETQGKTAQAKNMLSAFTPTIKRPAATSAASTTTTTITVECNDPPTTPKTKLPKTEESLVKNSPAQSAGVSKLTKVANQIADLSAGVNTPDRKMTIDKLLLSYVI